MVDRKVRVRFETLVPRDMTEEQLMEWLVFKLSSGGCDADNPLGDRDIEAEWQSIEVVRFR